MNFEEMSQEEILAIANPIMDNLMEASTEINHQKAKGEFVAEMVLVKVDGQYKCDHVMVF
ncbi:MAG: hypothetical protein CSA22_01290 [Deltaproteobacteria bacterium]|nr:MAG: hypothetical protein CSA22_01290 [Deltaproteobacteria bacterium]